MVLISDRLRPTTSVCRSAVSGAPRSTGRRSTRRPSHRPALDARRDVLACRPCPTCRSVRRGCRCLDLHVGPCIWSSRASSHLSGSAPEASCAHGQTSRTIVMESWSVGQ
jgi:hypothetical protein